jgi:hypothetical protein
MAHMFVRWRRRGRGNHFVCHLFHQSNAIHHGIIDSKIKSVDLEKNIQRGDIQPKFLSSGANKIEAKQKMRGKPIKGQQAKGEEKLLVLYHVIIPSLQA